MFGKKHDKDEKEKVSKIKKLVSNQKTIDRYILDDENAIVVIENNDRNAEGEYYIMIHQRLQDEKLVEINRWNISGYYFGGIHDVTVIKELNLFQIQNSCGKFNALYDYKNDKFVVPRGVWNFVDAGRRNNEILKKYNGFFASFEISSDYEEGDVYSYINPITNVKIVESFNVKDGTYYAMINIDGTIRGNKLFKGDSFSKITEIIDLEQYGSIESFKNERKQVCNDKKTKRKQEYQQMIAARNDGSISPYLDSEVAKILELKK